MKARVVQKNGITVDGRTYRSEYLIPYLKQKVTVIFDPDNMDKVSVFDMESKAICVATATVRPLFRHTTEEDYRQAGKEKKAVRAFNKKYKPARELSIQQLVAKQQFEELQYQQNLDTKVVEQINPMVATNSQKLKETEKPQRIPKEESIASILLKSYEAEKKAIGG